MTSPSTTPRTALLNKVPEITLWFWIIKILCTTVGETAADYLNMNLGFGLGGTIAATGVLLAVALGAQLKARRYLPALYWTTVALVSIFGTLVTDALATAGMPMPTATAIFAVLLAATFAAWYRVEGTLSIHSITTTRRELFYWTAILVTFALGTAAGDLFAETLGFGYLTTGVAVTIIIVLTAIGWRLGLDAILTFWVVYVLTRPLGASLGDLLTQPHEYGGLALGTSPTNLVFLTAIIALVLYLQISKIDRTPTHLSTVNAHSTTPTTPSEGTRRRVALQTLVLVGAILIAGATTYVVRSNNLDAAAADAKAAAIAQGGSPLGDLTEFRTITQDTLNLLTTGDQAGATQRVDDLERQWDTAQATLKPRDDAAWTTLDSKIDTVLHDLRTANPDPTTETRSLTDLLAAL